MKAIIVTLVLLAGMTVSVDAKMMPVRSFSVEEVKGRCDRAHGVFFNRSNGGSYGCDLPNGLVQCDVNHRCIGYSKHVPQVRRVLPIPPPSPDWGWWGDQNRWNNDQQRW